MLGEAFNNLVFPIIHEIFNAFIWFNGHVHDNMKVIQYCTPHLIIFDSIEHKHQTFKTCHV